MMAYWETVHQTSGHFDGLEFHHIKHDDNAAADILAKMGTRRELVPLNVFLE